MIITFPLFSCWQCGSQEWEQPTGHLLERKSLQRAADEMYVPVYDYSINIPYSSPGFKSSYFKGKEEYRRCEQCPDMINYGKDVKIQ